MKLLLIFLLASSSMQFCFSLNIDVKKFANLLNQAVGEISNIINFQSKQLISLEEYENGSVVNVPGEITQIPNLILSIINELSIAKNILINILGLFEKEYKSETSQSGAKLNIPNVVAQPFINLINPIENGLNNIISNAQVLGGVIQNGIIPLLTQTLQSNGVMIIPATDVNAIRSSLIKIVDELQVLSQQILNATTQSEDAKDSSESIKARTIMGFFDNFCKNFASQLIKILQQSVAVLNSVPVIQYNSSQDEVQMIVIVKNLNGFLGQVSQLIKYMHTLFAEAKTGINFIENPIGGVLFNFF